MAIQSISTLELDQQRLRVADDRDIRAASARDGMNRPAGIYRQPADDSYAALARTSTVTEASLKGLDTFGFILGTIITLGPLAATALLAH